MRDPLNIFGKNVALVICVPLVVYLCFIRRHIMTDYPITGAAKFDLRFHHCKSYFFLFVMNK